MALRFFNLKACCGKIPQQEERWFMMSCGMKDTVISLRLSHRENQMLEELLLQHNSLQSTYRNINRSELLRRLIINAYEQQFSFSGIG